MLLSIGDKLVLILNNLEHDMDNILFWFKVSLLKANPGSFQFMILGNKLPDKYALNSDYVSIRKRDELKLLGITIIKW